MAMKGQQQLQQQDISSRSSAFSWCLEKPSSSRSSSGAPGAPSASSTSHRSAYKRHSKYGLANEVHVNFTESGSIEIKDLLPSRRQQSSSGYHAPNATEMSLKDIEALGHELDSATLEEDCAICLETEPLDRNGSICLSKFCGHKFHKSCLLSWFREKKSCPCCGAMLLAKNVNGSKEEREVHIGHMPDGCMKWKTLPTQTPGTQSTHSIQVDFKFAPGTAVASSAQPVVVAGGSSSSSSSTTNNMRFYHGRKETAFLALNREGTTLLEMFKIAFKRRVMFGLGERLTTGTFAPTFNIHLKTRLDPVGAQRHGYPDEGYYGRTMQELKDNHVELEDIEIISPANEHQKSSSGAQALVVNFLSTTSSSSSSTSTSVALALSSGAALAPAASSSSSSSAGPKKRKTKNGG
ncbi:unnamed protein product [Amoebophrya sp. A25]|nr:unnamed protein product [Amoebophrya sp. A25]|eukprot:GSA25T00014809001.1